jgi:hypothetical protein
MNSNNRIPCIEYESWDEYVGLLESLVDAFTSLYGEGFDTIPSTDLLNDIGKCNGILKSLRNEGQKLVTSIIMKEKESTEHFSFLLSSQVLQIVVTTTRITIETMKMCRVQPMLFETLKQKIMINIDREISKYFMIDMISNPYLHKFEMNNFFQSKRNTRLPWTKYEETAMALCMGLNKRLGEKSRVVYLSEEILTIILQWI